MRKKRNWFLMQTNKISNSTAKKARRLPPLGSGKLGMDNTELGLVGHFHKCEYWLNAGHSTLAVLPS
jgi:hypothetical protein